MASTDQRAARDRNGIHQRKRKGGDSGRSSPHQRYDWMPLSLSDDSYWLEKLEPLFYIIIVAKPDCFRNWHGRNWVSSPVLLIPWFLLTRSACPRSERYTSTMRFEFVLFRMRSPCRAMIRFLMTELRSWKTSAAHAQQWWYKVARAPTQNPWSRQGCYRWQDLTLESHNLPMVFPVGAGFFPGRLQSSFYRMKPMLRPGPSSNWETMEEQQQSK